MPAPVFGRPAILGSLLALGDPALQLRFVLFVLPAQARFLDGEVVQVTAVGEKNLRFDHGLADRFVLFIGELGGELAAADSVDSGLERGNAIEPPERIGEGLGEALFFVAFGSELLEDSFDLRLIGRDVVGWQQDGAAGETGFQSVVGDFGFSFRRSGATWIAERWRGSPLAGLAMPFGSSIRGRVKCFGHAKARKHWIFGL